MTFDILHDFFLQFMTFDVMKKVLGTCLLYQHLRFSWDDLHQPAFQPVNYFLLSRHPHFDHEWFFRLPQRHRESIDWKHLSRTMSISFIMGHFRQYPWNIRELSFHPQLPIIFVLKNKKKKWDYDGISQHISLQDAWTFQKNIPLRFSYLSRNLHMRPWFIKEFLCKKWDRVQLAINPALRPSLIYHDPLLFPMWRWDHVVKNAALDEHTWQFLKTQLLLPHHIYLFKNKGCFDSRLQNACAFTLTKFIRFCSWKRKTRIRLYYLRKLHQFFPFELWNIIVSFV
jgi:hypothetical protein